MTLGPVRVMGAGVEVMCVEEVRKFNKVMLTIREDVIKNIPSLYVAQLKLGQHHCPR